MIKEYKSYHFKSTSDFAFKHIFGIEDSKNNLISLMNAINVIIILE